MIFLPQKYSYIFSDRIYSLAVGLLTGVAHMLLSLFLDKGKVKVFIKDMLTAFVFTVLLFSYVISFANYKVLRWYNVVFAIAGLVLFNPVTDNLFKVVISIANVTVKYLFKKVNVGISDIIKRKIIKIKEKSQNFPTENSGQLLQLDDKVLYN